MLVRKLGGNDFLHSRGHMFSLHVPHVPQVARVSELVVSSALNHLSIVLVVGGTECLVDSPELPYFKTGIKHHLPSRGPWTSFHHERAELLFYLLSPSQLREQIRVI
ncbi:hypothetical protein Mapa_007821 [Marchantia paleacea]|nr:hypothetical protein Mapa_007821 [Marchantia paleacea]